MTKARRPNSNTAAYAATAHQNAAQGAIEPPAYVTLPGECRPFWQAIVTSRARDTWTDSDLVTAANMARVQLALQTADVGSDDHAKLTRLALALSRSLSVHTTATAGRAADLVGASTAERQARQDDGDELIPRLRAV
ncbi:terminase [Pulveribacter suum]|uniref:Terminase n=1 Tax=Pulveribacter suum TaxID=2116657 RepID=A0A2P1NJ43_9BURK|nr:terminase [Pulveribacter suum]AVP57098.1 terminase [Pulveribacter suum]